jgi:hypothetical protein
MRPVLYQTTGPVTVRTAIELLETHGNKREIALFNNEHWYLTELKGMMEEFQSLDAPADSLRLEFYGGPPGRKAWYRGTLRDWMLDCIFQEEIDNQEFDLLIDFAAEQLPSDKRPPLRRADSVPF